VPNLQVATVKARAAAPELAAVAAGARTGDD